MITVLHTTHRFLHQEMRGCTFLTEGDIAENLYMLMVLEGCCHVPVDEPDRYQLKEAISSFFNQVTNTEVPYN